MQPHFVPNYNPTVTIMECLFLPYEATYAACDVATREPLVIRSGEWVHCWNVGEVLFCSPELYKEMLEAEYQADTCLSA